MNNFIAMLQEAGYVEDEDYEIHGYEVVLYRENSFSVRFFFSADGKFRWHQPEH
jgi:hypothetical protein